MSKKIIIHLGHVGKPSLSSLFKSHMLRRSSKREELDPYGLFEDYDDDEIRSMLEYYRAQSGLGPSEDDDDIYDEIAMAYGYCGHVGGKRKRRRRSSSARRSSKGKSTSGDPYVDYWNSEDSKPSTRRRGASKAEMLDNDETMFEHKEIFFYIDYADKNNRIEFNSLYDFDDFCNVNGYSVPQYLAEDLAYRRKSHCCLNPTLKDMGKYEVIGSSDYADMYYEACESAYSEVL